MFDNILQKALKEMWVVAPENRQEPVVADFSSLNPVVKFPKWFQDQSFHPIPSTWENGELRYVLPNYDFGQTFSNMHFVSHSDLDDLVVEVGLNGKFTGLLPWGNIGTYNKGLPVAFASYTQALRDRTVRERYAFGDNLNPTLDEVHHHRRLISNINMLHYPAVLLDKMQKQETDIPADMQINVTFTHSTGDSFVVPYEQVWSNEGWGEWDFEIENSYVQTLSGSMSSAQVLRNLHEYDVDISVENAPVDWADIVYVAAHRGGIQTTLESAMLAQKLGANTQILGISASRTHEGDKSTNPVDDVILSKPKGFNETGKYSNQFGEYLIGPNVEFINKHLTVYQPHDFNLKDADFVDIVDPMLATGFSTAKIAQELNSFGVDYEKISSIHQFAGGCKAMEVINEISDSQMSVYTVAWDNSWLSNNDYILPGFGDAGDDQFGNHLFDSPQDTLDAFSELMMLYEFKHDSSPLMKDILNSYALQITGEELILN